MKMEQCIISMIPKQFFAIGKKAASITPSTSNATTTVVNETKTKPVTKTVKSTRSVKLT